jgi:toxin ParE1/3/4
VASRVVWSQRALADVEAIAAYIAVDSSTYAKAVVRTIVTSIRALARFPRSGRKVPEFDDENTRELIAYSYRIIYTRTGSNHHRRSDPQQANAVTVPTASPLPCAEPEGYHRLCETCEPAQKFPHIPCDNSTCAHPHRTSTIAQHKE